MSNTRKSFVQTLEIGDSAVTLLKPFSGIHREFLFVIYEDAYGNISGELELLEEISKKYGIPMETLFEFISSCSS